MTNLALIAMPVVLFGRGAAPAVMAVPGLTEAGSSTGIGIRVTNLVDKVRSYGIDILVDRKGALAGGRGEERKDEEGV